MDIKAKAKWLSEFYAQVAEGGEPQYKYSGGWATTEGGPNLHSNKDDRRIKPALKVIDMSALIGSGILCVFGDGESAANIGYLRGVDGVYKCKTSMGTAKFTSHSSCVPQMNHWHHWDGGDCPLPEGFTGRAKRRDGLVMEQEPHHRWKHSGLDTDIIAFSVTGIAEGYKLPD